MKNLKKVLALALSATMALSMFVSAGAAFTDQADIKTADAVDKLVALNIINGNPDGSFKPDATVTRAEMAKMIYAVRNSGNTNADGYASMTSSFKDINSHWAAGYIKYCQSLNIIAGKSATQFDPDAAVTGTEAAKMLLVCAGYQADKAGLTGAGWDQKTLALASEAGLMDDVTASMAAGLPRQYTAQMISNALDAETVTYNADSATFEKKQVTKSTVKFTEQGYPYTVNETKNENVGEKFMKLKTIEAGVLTNVTKEDGKSTFSMESTLSAGFSKVSRDYSDMMGQTIKVMTKDGDTSKVYGVYADDDSKIIATASAGNLEKVAGENKQLKMSGTTYKFDDVVANYDAKLFNTDTTVKLSTLIDNAAVASHKIVLIDNNGNGKVDNIVVTPLDVKKVTYVGTTSITAGNKSYKFDDDNIYDGVKKDDYAVIVSGDYTVDGDALLTKADSIEGTVNGIKSGTPDQIQVDSTWYKMGGDASTPSVGDKGSFIVVNGYVYGVDTSASGSKDIMYIAGSAKNDNKFGGDATVEVKAYFADGTNKIVKIAKFNGLKPAAKNAAGAMTDEKPVFTNENDLKGFVFTYSINSDGNYEVKELANADNTPAKIGNKALKKNLAGYDSYDATAGAYSNGNDKLDKYPVQDDSIVFVQTDKETKVLTGKTIKNWGTISGTTSITAKGALVSKTNGINYAKVAAMVIGGDIDVPGANGDKLYGYLTSDSYETKQNGDTVTAFPIWTGSETKIVYEKNTANTGWKAGSAMQYHMDGDRIVADKNLVDATDAYAIVGMEYEKKGAINVVDYATGTSNSSYKLDEDVVFIGIDDSEKIGAESAMNAVAFAQQDEHGNYYANAYLMIDGDKVLAVIFDTDKLDMENAICKPALSVSKGALSGSGTGTYDVSIVNNVTSARPGTTITVKVECTAFSTAGKTDVVTVKNGASTIGTLQFAGTGTQQISFTMGNSAATINWDITTK